MAQKYSFELEEDMVMIMKGEYLVAEFYPDVEEGEGDEEYVPEFNSGVLDYPVIYTRKFIEEHFEEGEGLDKLEAVLTSYLETVKAWKEFLKKNPDVKVESDGFAKFAAKVFVRFDSKLKLDESCIKPLEEKLTPILEALESVAKVD